MGADMLCCRMMLSGFVQGCRLHTLAMIHDAHWLMRYGQLLGSMLRNRRGIGGGHTKTSSNHLQHKHSEYSACNAFTAKLRP